MSKLLVIEDDIEMQKLIGNCLDGHSLTFANNAEEGSNFLSNLQFDLVILDITLPNKDGITLFGEFKNHPKLSKIPVVFLTAKNEVKDKVLGLSMGAEDYITKPFDRSEFKARIELRISKAKSASHKIEKANLHLDLNDRKISVIKDGKENEVRVTAAEFRILYFLVTHENEVITRQQLLENLWGENINVVDRVIDAHLCNLRKKIKETPYQIKSVYGKGYRFSEKPIFQKNKLAA